MVKVDGGKGSAGQNGAEGSQGLSPDPDYDWWFDNHSCDNFCPGDSGQTRDRLSNLFDCERGSRDHNRGCDANHRNHCWTIKAHIGADGENGGKGMCKFLMPLN